MTDSLATAFPLAEETIRDRIEDLIVPSESVVQTLVEEDAPQRFWVTVSCQMVGFSSRAAFSRDDLDSAGGAWPFWCGRVIEELDRRLRERAKSGW